MRFATLLILVSLFCSQVYAQSVSGVTGVIADGETITISGSSFGTRNDNGGATDYLNFKWDDFEDGVATDQYDATADGSLTTSGNRVNSTYCFARDHNTDNGLGVAVGETATNDGYYVFFWARRTANPSASDSQEKTVRIFTNGIDDPYPNITVGKHDFSGDTQHLVTIEASSGSTPVNSQIGENTFWSDLAWHYMEVWFKPMTTVGPDSNDGEIEVWIGNTQAYNISNATTDSVANNVNTYNGSLRVFGFLRSALGDILIDDVYMDYSKSRVLLCDAPTRAGSTQVEIQPLLSWSDSSISIELNTGAFTEGSTAYLIVIDGSGNESAGYAIQIGSVSNLSFRGNFDLVVTGTGKVVV